MLTAASAHAIELETLINEDIEMLKEQLLAPYIEEVKFRTITGQISGLRMALEISKLATENVEKR